LLKYIDYLLKKKIRLNILIYLLNKILYNIKYRIVGMDFSIEKRKHEDMYEQWDSGSEIDIILSVIDVKSTDSIIDIGSGKGGAVIALSKYPFNKVDGIELYSDLYEISKRNILKTKHRNIRIYCDDAQTFKGYSQYNVFYMYNPFSGNIMKNVLKQISHSLKETPRDILLIYFNPIFHSIVTESGIFIKCIDPNIFSISVKVYSTDKNFSLKQVS